MSEIHKQIEKLKQDYKNLVDSRDKELKKQMPILEKQCSPAQFQLLKDAMKNETVQTFKADIFTEKFENLK